MKLAIAIVAALSVVVAHGFTPGAVDPVTAVGFQAAVSKQFLLSFEKIMIAQHWSYAGSTYLSMLTQRMQQQPQAFVNLEEDEDVIKDAEGGDVDEADVDAAEVAEADEDFESFLEMGEAGTSDSAKVAMMAAYELYTGVKRWLHVTIFTSGDIQSSYWTDRALQYQLQGLMSQLPPQFAQFLYMRAFRTQLQTLKFAFQLQTITFLTTWLEDELEVSAALALGNSYEDVINVNQELDLVQEKSYAFQTFTTMAQLDLFTFYIDMYLNNILMSLAMQQGGGGPSNSTSFLETEMKEGAEASPFFSPGNGGVGFNPQIMMWFYFFRTLLQYQCAEAGLTSAMSESLALQKETDADPTNDRDAVGHRAFARQSFGSFAMFLAQMAQIDMWIGMLGIFQIYGAMYGGGQAASSNASASS